MVTTSTHAKSIGLVHGLTNVIVVGLFIVSWLLRRPNPFAPDLLEIVRGIVAVALAQKRFHDAG